MRVAVINRMAARVGGTESYLDGILPALAEVGCELGLWCENGAGGTAPVRLPEGTKFWCADEAGIEPALRALADWRPELLYVHGLHDASLEQRLQRLAPAVFFAHDYYGTCVSGKKTYSFPYPQPCERRLGLACLACYFPRRCGGLNPVTMWKQYRQQVQRLHNLRNYRVVLTHSSHMQEELRRHGIAAEKIAYYATAGGSSESAVRGATGRTWKLLFLGRFDHLKGGRQLLEALPLVHRQLGRPLHLTLAGDGPCRQAWQALATRIGQDAPELRIEFPGWVSTDARDVLLRQAHLLVVPSLWPEPFGRIGPEAGSVGLPVVAFDVGGVREWLTHGENGFLVPGRPPTVSGLARAIVQALSDRDAYEGLCGRARALSARFTKARHVQDLYAVFQRVAGLGTS